MPKRTKWLLLLLGLLIIASIIIIIINIPTVRICQGPDIQCSHNLQNLFIGICIYESEYGHYPNRQGSAFWEVLRTLPTPEKSALGNRSDRLFVCPYHKDKKTTGPGICHYRGPNYDVTDKIDENTPLGSDLPGNHPDGMTYVLYMNGKIESVKPGTPEWEKAEKYLTK